ncbi:MAG: enoyl-CoA hydratase/isomerase [Gammaproteobacteria bacterium]|nr:enoyl-CoA hydratase/isomerase [Gammaproteobacteria bacterium]MCW5583721.1 enoyl-CoA hydratase/isomerase [Gammaproteobacteria bacterium]
MSNPPNHQTIRVHVEGEIGYLQIYRPDANNTINDALIQECTQVLNTWTETIKIIVLEGLPTVFCFGADFQGMASAFANGNLPEQNPEPLYDLWLKLATGPFITVANIKGKVNAGGIGFVSACDIALAEETTVFSLSELLFSLMPACVLPFLIRKIGYQSAHYMTMMTQPISAMQAFDMGLVDAIGPNSDDLLRKHLLRLKYLSKKSIVRYKDYMNQLDNSCIIHKEKALSANKLVFSDTSTIEKISRYYETGKFPWESDNAGTDSSP